MVRYEPFSDGGCEKDKENDNGNILKNIINIFNDLFWRL
jgi:hypothetical protein